MNEEEEFIESLKVSEDQRRQFASTVKTLMLELVDKNEMTNKEMKELSENLFEPLTSLAFQTLYVQGGKGTNGIYRMLFGLRVLDGKHLLDIAKDDYGWTEKNIPDGYGIIDTLDDLKTPIILPKEIVTINEKNILISELLSVGTEILFGSPIAHNSGDWAMMFPPLEITNDEKALNEWKELNWEYLWDRWLVVKSVSTPTIELQDPLSNKTFFVRTICIGQIDGIWVKNKKNNLKNNTIVNIDEITSDAILKLHALMIKADDKNNTDEIKQAVYFLNKGIKLNTSKKQISELLNLNINLDNELYIISQANLSKEVKELILSSLVMIAVSDSEYHPKESDLVKKVAKEFNLEMDTNEIERLTKLQSDLSSIRDRIEIGEKNINDVIQTKDKLNTNNVKKILNDYVNKIDETTSVVGKVMADAIKNKEITTEEMLAYLDFLKEMGPEFQFMAGTLAKYSPQKFIENVKAASEEDEVEINNEKQVNKPSKYDQNKNKISSKSGISWIMGRLFWIIVCLIFLVATLYSLSLIG